MDEIWSHIQELRPNERSSEEDDGVYQQALWRGMDALSATQEAPTTDNYEKAAEHFIEAIQLEPQRFEAYVGISYWLVLLGDELSAIHYAHRILELEPKVQQTREMLDLLESSHRLNSLMDEVEKMGNIVEPEQTEDSVVLSLEESNELVAQTELLMRVHHNLLEVELNHGMFQRLEQLHSRQRSLETLHQLIADHLTYFLEDKNWQVKLQNRLDVLSYDLESLENLESQFDQMRLFQKEVQALFRDLTRAIIRLRMKGAEVATESEEYGRQLRGREQKLAMQLDKYPHSLKKQVESVSGWAHLHQQLNQFSELVDQYRR